MDGNYLVELYEEIDMDWYEFRADCAPTFWDRLEHPVRALAGADTAVFSGAQRAVLRLGLDAMRGPRAEVKRWYRRHQITRLGAASRLYASLVGASEALTPILSNLHLTHDL